jgi:hypothetical protein
LYWLSVVRAIASVVGITQVFSALGAVVCLVALWGWRGDNLELCTISINLAMRLALTRVRFIAV